MKFSIITTCKNRLAHLRRSLPGFLAQPDAEVIVVDFDCPAGTADVVEAEFPAARVVRVTNKPIWNASEARNAGAAAATGEFLFFIDADIILAPGITQKITTIDGNKYGEFIGSNDVRGTCIVPADAFRAINGYDEVMLGSAAEDLDLYGRLRFYGLAREVMDKDFITEVIRHSTLERVQFVDVGRKLGFARGQLYRETKNMLMRFELKCDLDIRLRRALWERINDIIHSPQVFEETQWLEVPLPPIRTNGIIPGCEFGRSLRMSIKLAR